MLQSAVIIASLADCPSVQVVAFVAPARMAECFANHTLNHH